MSMSETLARQLATTPSSVPDAWRYWSPDELADLTECPREKVREHWPRLNDQLALCQLDDLATHIAVAATIPIETAHRFEPIHEFRMADGSIPSWWYSYDGGPEYHGRGFIQNTHLYNYRDLGPKIAALWATSPNQSAFDFVTHPDNLLNPDASAAAAAIYVRDRRGVDGDSIPAAAARGDWRTVRKLVQGGDAGLSMLVRYATSLGGATEAQVGDAATYSLDVPDGVILQHNNWTCSVRSTYAGLWAMAQVGHGDPVTYGDGGHRDVYDWLVPEYASPAVGLHRGDGSEIAALLRDKGYDAGYLYPATLEDVRARAGKQPVMIGGMSWYHWVYVRGKAGDGGLILENPSPGYGGVGNYLRDSFGSLGPFAMVWAAPLGAPIEPVPPEDGEDTMEELQNLVGNAYHESGVVVPALAGALKNPDNANLRVQVDAVTRWLRSNNPHPGQ